MKKFSFFLNCAATALFAIALTAWQDVKDNPSSEENPAKQTITIQSGDTLTAIGRKYNVSVNDLVAWNNIKNPDLIYINQKLTIYPTILR